MVIEIVDHYNMSGEPKKFVAVPFSEVGDKEWRLTIISIAKKLNIPYKGKDSTDRILQKIRSRVLTGKRISIPYENTEEPLTENELALIGTMFGVSLEYIEGPIWSLVKTPILDCIYC